MSPKEAFFKKEISEALCTIRPIVTTMRLHLTKLQEGEILRNNLRLKEGASRSSLRLCPVCSEDVPECLFFYNNEHTKLLHLFLLPRDD